jgi:fatty acid desaturase
MWLGAVAVGYGVAYLQLFLHEASHYHLARERALNDRLCDAVISWHVGTTVSRYRPIHFAHHRYLGTRSDTENSYFRPLGFRLILATLTGVHALRILVHRRRQLARLPAAADGPVPRGSSGLVRGILLHGLVATGAFALSGWPGPGAWLLGVGAFFPVFATVRQLLEHRSADADPSADYTHQDHGALTRMFGAGPLASTFGGAGFNRHLLHHWEPQVAYTRLGDLERYLDGSSAAPILAARRSQYLRTLALLWNGSQATRTRGGEEPA